ncbi:hypothetical protein ACFWFF_34115 [Streptomyces sp. NPDC060223]|uniref:hypothetical protein n=1 Tax=unclassified Streptomyces TaxID=2593676 RepID=UPI00363B5B51
MSAGLRMNTSADSADEVADPETESDRMDGWIWRPHLRSFLKSLARYNGTHLDDTDWDVISIGLAPTDDEDPDAWYSWPCPVCPTPSTSVSRTLGGNEVSVVITGATSADLRLRIDTLMDAFAR